MRITGGIARGIVLRSPRGDTVRPATDQMRQAVFNRLGESVAHARCLDLFAGTGSYGLEALSRGAASCTFVERDRTALAALATNLTAVCHSASRPQSVGRITGTDATRWSAPPGTTFDLIFADPPYDLAEASGTELVARYGSWLAPGGFLVFEVPGIQDLPAPPGLVFERQLGTGPRQPSARIFRRDAASSPTLTLDSPPPSP